MNLRSWQAEQWRQHDQDVHLALDVSHPVPFPKATELAGPFLALNSVLAAVISKTMCTIHPALVGRIWGVVQPPQQKRESVITGRSLAA